MNYTNYPAYEKKIDWLGNVPENWDVIKLKWIFKRKKITDRADAELLSVYRDYGVIPKSSRDDNFNKPSDDLSTYQLVEIGDLVLNKMKTWQGSIAISEFEGIVSPAYIVAEPLKDMNLRYIHYLLRSSVYIGQYKRYSSGIRPNQWDLNFENFGQLQALLPSFEEQQSIANFLDTKTTLIDDLISKKENQVELLKEKRTAIINNAVTKGLDPNVPMKDSGVEWLKKIPEHWSVLPLKSVFNIIYRYPTYYNIQYVNEGVPEVRGEALGSDGKIIKLDDERYISAETNNIFPRTILKSGDLVMSVRGTMGKIAVVDESYDGANITANLLRLSPNGKAVSDYLVNLFLSEYFLKCLDKWSSQTTIKTITVPQLTQIMLPIPPSLEQKAIVRYLDERVNQIDILVGKLQTQIEKLREYRQSLISAAVTGKIDVRETLHAS